MIERGFDSPEAAAMSTFPAKYCSVISARGEGDDAYVLLNTGTRDQPYLYGVHCSRESGQWFEGYSSNGRGWHQTGDDPDVGTLSEWADAPSGATAVMIEFKGEVIEVAVTEGAYLAVWWRVRAPSAWPRVLEFKRLH